MPIKKSARRESNSRFLHGEQAGCHYTTGAFAELLKHRAGIEPAFPRYEGGVLPIDDQCLSRSAKVGSVGLEPTSLGLRDRHIALSATIPFLFRFSRVLRGRTEILLLPKQACSHLHLYPNRGTLATTLRGDSRSFKNRTHAPHRVVQWTCWELNPEALIANQNADPSASPSKFINHRSQ
jgi:hypothetical protein